MTLEETVSGVESVAEAICLVGELLRSLTEQREHLRGLEVTERREGSSQLDILDGALEHL
ncbi:hypothetical protein AB0H37_18980 [Actinomadura sp. NPDC023710]|uniref:hypothetical protein n=1 Tax=Actinomadura sp. NPDC023710 TaxID=3158219 RepID=UPI0033CB9977